MRGIKGEIVVDEDAYSISMFLGIDVALIFSISVIQGFALHFNNKINNVFDGSIVILSSLTTI